MLDATLQSQLQDYLERVSDPIEIVASVDGSAQSVEMLALLRDLAGLSPLLSLRERRDGGERMPSFSVGRPGGVHGIRFAGIPTGHEFTSWVLALLQVGGYAPNADAEAMERVRGLAGEFVFETYISLSCQNCPDVVQALNLMSVLNPNIRHTMIDGALFQDEVNERRIMAVPTVLLNGGPFGQGRMSFEEMVAKLDRGASARDAAKLAEKAPFDMLVIGGNLRRPQGNSDRAGGGAFRRSGA